MGLVRQRQPGSSWEEKAGLGGPTAQTVWSHVRTGSPWGIVVAGAVMEAGWKRRGGQAAAGAGGWEEGEGGGRNAWWPQL